MKQNATATASKQINFSLKIFYGFLNNSKDQNSVFGNFPMCKTITS